MAAMVVNMKTEGLKEDFDGVFDISVRTWGTVKMEEKVNQLSQLNLLFRY